MQTIGDSRSAAIRSPGWRSISATAQRACYFTCFGRGAGRSALLILWISGRLRTTANARRSLRPAERRQRCDEQELLLALARAEPALWALRVLARGAACLRDLRSNEPFSCPELPVIALLLGGVLTALAPWWALLAVVFAWAESSVFSYVRWTFSAEPPDRAAELSPFRRHTNRLRVRCVREGASQLPSARRQSIASGPDAGGWVNRFENLRHAVACAPTATQKT